MSETSNAKPAGKARSGGRSGNKSGDKPDGVGDDVITIKKYANRRLYNTATSSYVTLDFLSEMVKGGQDFVVYDARSGEDITRPVLTQIIFEQENKGHNLLPVQFLRQLIGYYGDSMQNYVPSYLEMSMDAFSRNRDSFKKQLSETMETAPGFKMIEASVRKNMTLYEQAMKMFTTMPATGMPGFPPAAPPEETTPTTDDPQDIDEIKRQLAVLQEQLAKIEK